MLSCNHKRVFPPPVPVKGESLYCTECREYHNVVVSAHEYRVKCRNCRMGRSFGRAVYGASSAVARHRGRFPAHVVDLWDGEVIEWTYDETTDPLPLSDEDTPPF